jgi:formate hydrogenlyase subunit 3/multisubunit Na+/H+ antiporter MnhD subunit
MAALIVAAFLGPLLLALLVLLPSASRRVGQALAPLAPLPALVLALFGPDGFALEVSWLLLGSTFVLDALGSLFLGFTALVWLIAGWYARAYLLEDPGRPRFWTFFLATQAGNLGLCLAADAVSFYLFFAVMTFAAYGLVVHDGSVEAYRAGRVYIVMAVLGEAALVVALLMVTAAAGSIRVDDIAATPQSALAVALLLAGFGVKVGVPLLHMWLPLAHPVAPVPASAVLSGVMLKAGVLGWLRFLPLGGEPLPMLGAALSAAALAAMFLGVAAGLMQRDAKVLLAYSSVSQMGYLSLTVGLGLVAPAMWPALLPAVGLYALHHALAKSALFLGAGVVQARGARSWVLAGLSLPALALAGAPLTSGMLAKLELKAVATELPSEWAQPLVWLLPLAAVGTGLLMARLLILATGQAGRRSSRGLAAPWWTLVALGMLLPWWLAPAPDLEEIFDTVWPLVLALALSALAVRRGLEPPSLPPGDLVVPIERLLAQTRPASGIARRPRTS